MAWIMQGYSCQCGHEYEELKDRLENPMQECPRCGWENKPTLGGKLGAFSAMSREAQTEHLKKRSADHSKKMMKE